MGLLDGTTAEDYYNSSDLGNYQFTSLNDIINNFISIYVGEEKVIGKVSRTDVAFYAQRALQELSFDTFKSCKSQEITQPPSLTMMLPQDYVNYVKLSWSDGSGIKHVLYPTSKTSNPEQVQQNSDGTYTFDGVTGDLLTDNTSATWDTYNSSAPAENQNSYDDEIWPLTEGRRYGIDPQHSQVNGSFYIDCNTGKIHFSSNMNGKIIILDYISDSLGTDEEMKVHKFAEEAIYKWIMHSIVSTKIGIPEYTIIRYKKEKRAAIRQAKLRLSNIKLEEITQIFRGKAKQIKH